MSSTFSTVINFGMLGLLRRLHRLHIQFTLEAQTEITGIRYPRVEAHKAKDGCGNEQDNMGEVHSITEADIASAVETARSKARYLVETLGMDKSLRLDNCLDNPPVPFLREDVIWENEDNADECINEITPDMLRECFDGQNQHDISSSISTLSNAGIIDYLHT